MNTDWEIKLNQVDEHWWEIKLNPVDEHWLRN